MKTNQPLVSVLIPAYNVAHFLPRCLDSIISQIYSNLQIVVIDDGSRDNTREVCEDYLERDKRIEFYHQENSGVAITRNHLLDKVRGDYVLFVDADDWVELDMVEYLVWLAEEHNADMVMCDRVINDANPSIKEPTINTLSQDEAIRDFILHGYFDGSLWNKLLRRSLLHDEQFPNKISYGEDALFCWNVLQKVNRVVVTDKQLYHYRMNDDSLSHSYNGHQFSAYYVWEQIVKDVSTDYPTYFSLAQAQFCNQMTIILYDAARHGYNEDNHTKQLGKVVAKYRHEMRRMGCSLKKYIFSYILCYHYNLAHKLLKLF